jgi:hypothetical protein
MENLKMAYVNYGWFAPAVPTSGYVAVPKKKELNTILLDYHKDPKLLGINFTSQSIAGIHSEYLLFLSSSFR